MNRKLISIVLMITLVSMLFVGCAKNNNSSNDTASQAEQPAAETQQDTQQAEPAEEPAKEEEPVRLTMKTYHANKPAHDNFYESEFGKIIKERTNVEVSIQGASTDNATQDLLTDIAAGTLPDIFMVWISAVDTSQLSVVMKAAKEEVLADVSEAVKNYPIINKAVQRENLPLYTANTIYDEDFNGKLFFLPANQSVVSPWLSGWGLYIRDDVAKAVDLPTPAPEIKTADDFYNLLKKIKDKKLKDANGKEIYPLGSIAQWPHIMSAMNRPFDFGGAAKIGIQDGKVTGFIQTHYAWDQILFMRKLIADGLLDPEALTQTYEIGAEKLAQGRYAITPMYKFMPLPEASPLAKEHPEMAYVPLGNLQNFMGEDEVTINKGMEAHMLIGIKNGANVDAALRLLEFLSSKEGKVIGNFGIEGKGWFWNDKGFAEQIKNEEVKAAVEADPDAWRLANGYGEMEMFHMIGGQDNPDTNPWGGDGRNPSYQTDTSLDDAQNVNVQGVMPNIKVVNQLNLDSLLFKYPDFEKIDPILKMQPDILIQSYLVKTEAEAKKVYEGYLDTLNKNGYADYLAYIQAAYDQNPDQFAPYVTEVQ